MFKLRSKIFTHSTFSYQVYLHIADASKLELTFCIENIQVRTIENLTLTWPLIGSSTWWTLKYNSSELKLNKFQNFLLIFLFNINRCTCKAFSEIVGCENIEMVIIKPLVWINELIFPDCSWRCWVQITTSN